MKWKSNELKNRGWCSHLWFYYLEEYGRGQFPRLEAKRCAAVKISSISEEDVDVDIIISEIETKDFSQTSLQPFEITLLKDLIKA
ncbi:hypothetical protein D7Z54_07285 [Salibacterium salarium]|uniref:Uncharacterized protein n=1 Tax=Salibacterium salarium TaxID=284579 RepID=A0A428N608_9BACI|nr:hypothetical protein D7Z54_07285 [Salibacterium salarium]